MTRFLCDNCKQEKAVMDGDYRRVEVRVKKEINRLHNNEEWQNIVRRQMAERNQKMARA